MTPNDPFVTNQHAVQQNGAAEGVTRSNSKAARKVYFDTPGSHVS